MVQLRDIDFILISRIYYELICDFKDNKSIPFSEIGKATTKGNEKEG